MLNKLNIQNIALIDNCSLNFNNGLTVLTGETGAGKSVIVSAISLILGGRSDKDLIRHGEKLASVEAEFDISSMPATYKTDFSEFIDNNKITIKRELKTTGKPKILISNILSTLSELKELTSPLSEILGQHANQLLMQEENHIIFLDNFANLTELKDSVKSKYHFWKESYDLLKKTINKRDSYKNERELLLFQQKEISDAKIEIGESETILSEKKILDSSRALMSSSQLISESLENENSSVLPLLQVALKEIETMHEVDSTLSKQVEELTDIVYRIGDMKQFIEQYGSSISDDPNRIEEINRRLDELYILKKKYGGTEESIITALEAISESLKSIPTDIDSYIDELEQKTNNLFDKYSNEAIALSDTRIKASKYLEKLVQKELTELAISNCGFQLEFIYEDDSTGVLLHDKLVKASEDGLETARILFSANVGEPLKSLVKTASGGEISRVLLAMKSAEKKNNNLPNSLLVFDEVDAGIGGQTAVEVANKIKKLASNNQLLVITHLHQIARVADNHFVVQKTSAKDNRTVINVVSLDKVGKDSELKRMIALPED